MKDRFEQFNEDYLKFDRVVNKRSQRRDLHAFMLLDELFLSEDKIVSAKGDYEIYLSISEEQIETLTDGQILELVRCGVMYSSYDCLEMFV
jgi:hypothetical protein